MNRGTGYYHLLPALVLYLFFNGFLLPQGLLYTALLSPVLVYFVYKNSRQAPSPAWLLLLLLPVPFHLYHEVDSRSYLVSSTLVLTAMIFLYASVAAIKKYSRDLSPLFRTILVINGWLVLAALLTLPIAQIRDWLWYSVPVSAGIGSFPRLKLFTYEASYYAFIMMPVFLYFFYRVMYGLEKHPLLIAAACLAPLALSLSFGVIGAAIPALLAAVILYRHRLPSSFLRHSFYGVATVLLAAVVLLLLWPSNPVFQRTINIFSGKDTSAMGRLVYSFMFARDLAASGNWLFGIGPGQIKILAHDLIVNHYHYHGEVAETVRIPNAMAEMVATYGMYGGVAKIFLELWLFVRTRVWKNTYSFTLFLFLFFYQFTGSFLVNVAELGGWALAFGARFAEFDVTRAAGEQEVTE